MFTITNNGSAFYDPRLQGFVIDKPKLVQEANAFGALSFTLYPPHPAYDQLKKTDNILSLYQDGNLLGQYIPTYKRRVFNSGIEYKCKNIICLLDDYYYRSTEFTGSAQAFIESVLSSYNSHIGAAYKIYAGNIHSASVKYEAPTPDTCWDALQTVVEKNKGYFAPRISGGTIYLDYLTESDLPVSEQKIVFGENMTDLFIETDTDNCYSVLYPFGTTEDDEPVSIASVNGGVDYLENASAVAAYGRREKRISWTNVESPAQLLSKAQEQLSEIAALFAESVQLSAVDLHDAGIDVSSLAFLTRIDCISAPHGYSHRYPATRMETVLDAPQSVSLNLGQIPMTLTDSFALERKKNASSRGGGGRAQAKAEKEFKKFETFYTQTDEKFNWLATESEWDELAQEGHVTAFTELTRTARYVEDSAKIELPFADWKSQWIAAHPEDASLTDEELTSKYNEWIKVNPYAIYNTEYSDATRTERIISKTGINSLGEDETVLSRITQEAGRVESSIYSSQSQIYSAISQTASNIQAELVSSEQGLYTYINLTASGIRQQIANAGNRTIVNDTDPRSSTYEPKDGDIWIESVHDGTWDGADGFDWEHDEDYDWTQVQGAKAWVWKNNQWQLVTDRQQLVTYSDFVNTADILISQKIAALANEEGQVEVYRSLIEQSAERIRSEVYGATSDIYSYIHQTASSVSIAAGQRPTTVVQNSHTSGEPTSINGRGLKENDIWIDTADQDSWDTALNFNWNDDVQYNWNDLRSDKIYVYRNGAWQLAVDGTILAEDTDLQVERDRIALLARNIDTLDGYARENFAQFNVKASEIYSEVLDRTNDLGSRITQTATQIRSEVHASNSQIYSEIVQTASNILLHVENEISDMGSALEVTAGQIRSDVYAAKSSLYSSITQTASSIKSEVTAAKSSLYSSITQTANSIKSEVYAAKSSLYSSISQTASSIRSEVNSTKSSLYSSITQTASSIRSEVTAAKSSLYTSIITQTASSIKSEVTAAKSSLYSSITQTASSIRSEITSAKSTLYSSIITQTASSIKSEVTAAKSSLYSSITQTASSIRSEITSAKSTLYSSIITQTASSIKSEVTAAKSSLYSSITQTASSIKSEVYSAESSIYSSITQTASSIKSELYSAKSSIYSSITQTSSQIALKVSKGDVASAINQTAQTVQISASKINLEGYVTAEELSTVSASIQNLTSGATTAGSLKTNLLSASTGFTYIGSAISKNTVTMGNVKSANKVLATGAISLSHSHKITLSESGGVVTATIGGAQAANGTANFNIADTAYFKDAVSAARAHSLSTITLEDSDTGKSTQTVTVLSEDDEEIDLDTTVDASAVYEAGKNAAHAEYTSNTGYLRGNSVTVTPVGSTSYLMTFYANTTLYKKNGDNYESVGAHPWYYVGSGGTRLYVAGSSTTYYNSGDSITYYTRTIPSGG